MANEVHEIIKEFYVTDPDLMYSVRARVIARIDDGKIVYRYETSHSCTGLPGGGDAEDKLDINIKLAKVFLMSFDWKTARKNEWY